MINGLPRSLYIVSVAAFMFQLARFLTQPIFTLYIIDLGASILQVGVILSIQSFLLIVLRIPLTVLAQKIGRSRMILVTFTVQATVPILYFLAETPTWLYFIPFYEVIATGSFHQLFLTMVSDMAPSTRQGDALGRYMASFSMGMFIGPIITSALIAVINYRQLFLVSAVFPAMGLAIIQRYSSKLGMKKTSVGSNIQSNNPSTYSSLKTVHRERNVLVLSIIRTTYAMSNSMFTTIFAIYAVQHLEYSPSLVALLFSVIGFSQAVVKIPAGRISDRVGRKKLLLITFGGIILVYFLISNIRGLIILSVALVLFGACWGTRAVTEWTLLANTVSTETKPIAISYLSIFWGVGATVGSVFAGISAQVLPYPLIFVLMALINVPAIPSIYSMRNPKK